MLRHTNILTFAHSTVCIFKRMHIANSDSRKN